MRRRFFPFLTAVLAATAFLIFAHRAHAEEARVTLVSTTDLHGHIFPIDYYTNEPSNDGLAKVATVVRRLRKEDPNLLLIDCGDTIQGTPLAYHHNRLNNAPVDPMMLTMNALGFDALIVGNHEFNFGPDVLKKAQREARFPWMSANTLNAGTGTPAFTPYLVRVVNGVRVGVLSLTTPGVPSWENKPNYAGLEFADPVRSAERWVRVLRQDEKVDVVVAAMHMGMEFNPTTGVPHPGQVPGENAALAIARGVPGIDVILMGHTHQSVPELFDHSVLLAQANRYGDRVIRVTLQLERADRTAPWRLVAKNSTSLPVTGVPPDPEILDLARPYHEETQRWLDTPIGECAEELTAADSYVQDSAIIDLVQRAMLESGKADVSFTASFNLKARLPKGSVTVRNISSLYVYENTLVVVELTGAQIKEALEFSARFFLPAQTGKTARELINPQIWGYNFDIAEGVDYTLDLRRPLGDRVVGLTFRGKPLDPGQKLRVAINNYRVNGGGGYTMFRDAPVLERSGTEIRDLLIAWVQKHRQIPTQPTGNWRIVTE